MKITHCIFTMRTGGAQMLVVDILNRLHPEHEVSLVIVNDEFENSILDKLDKKIKVYFLNRRQGSKSPIPVLKLNLLLFKLAPDVIHCHEVNMVNFIYASRSRTILTVHNVGYPKIEEKKYRRLVAISDIVAQDVKNRFHVAIPVVQNGIIFEDFRRKRDYSFQGSIRLLQISRLRHEAKGQDVLINALAILVSQNPQVNITVDFVGEGPSYEMLNDLVRKHKLEKYIRFLGNQNRDWIMDNTAEYDILIQPSRFEGFGLTVIEGIAAGLPVIASNIDGPAEIFKSIENKFLFKSTDEGDCAFMINKVIGMYQSSLVDGYMNELYSKISSQYSIDSTVRGYISEYQKV